MAHVGQDVELECAFPWTEPRELYSIKWWRDNDQFYQYIPKNPDPKMMFNVTGIKVDVSTRGVLVILYFVFVFTCQGKVSVRFEAI